MSAIARDLLFVIAKDKKYMQTDKDYFPISDDRHLDIANELRSPKPPP